MPEENPFDQTASPLEERINANEAAQFRNKILELGAVDDQNQGCFQLDTTAQGEHGMLAFYVRDQTSRDAIIKLLTEGGGYKNDGDVSGGLPRDTGYFLASDDPLPDGSYMFRIFLKKEHGVRPS